MADKPEMDLAHALPLPACHYDSQNGGKSYFMKNDRGNYIAHGIPDVRRRLVRLGVSDTRGKNQLLSDFDVFMDDVNHKHDVDYAGPLAGYLVGPHSIQNRRVLVTEPPHFIEAKEGEWNTIHQILRGLLVALAADDPEMLAGDVPNENHVGLQQLHTLYSWLKTGIAALRAGERRPGQVLVLAGPRDCGKSLLQNLITKMLGGRSAKPYHFMTGGTQFNSDLFMAEHLMIEDEAASFDFRIRRKLGANLKGMVANEDQRCHPKGRQALMLTPFWRVSITLNDGAEDLMVLPVLDESIQDKVILLRAHMGERPWVTTTLDQRRAFMGLLNAELPHFIHFLLNTWQIPCDMQCSRYGVTHYHHPELMQMMSVLSPEAKLLELIDSRLWTGTGKLLGDLEQWKGRSSELEALLTEKEAGTAYEARKLLLYNSACGQYLGRLEKQFPDRVQNTGKVKGYWRWVIKPPALDAEVEG